MASHGVLVQEKVAALNIDAFNRACVSASDIDNGFVFQLATKSATAGESEMWVATAPTTGAGLTNLWMAYEPEVPIVVSATGKEYKGINPDPREFYTVAGKPFSAFRLSLGDLLLLTDEALDGTKSTNGFVVATNGTFKLTWAGAAISGVSLALLATSYISIGSGAIDTQRDVAYKFEVVALA